MTEKPPRPERIKTVIRHEDGKLRCPWPGTDPFYVAYHDEEWGVPEWESRALFEKLILDGFQAGLSWITILRKRDNFRAAFDGFAPEIIAQYSPEKYEALMLDAGIVRNRSKIVSTVKSAQAYLEIEARQGFSNYMWDFIDGRPIQNKPLTTSDIKAETPLAQKISKDLRAKGFNFCGPTIVYAFMQAVGMVNDHLVDCYRHEECAALAQGR